MNNSINHDFTFKWISFAIWLIIIITFIIIEISTNGIWSGIVSVAALPSLIISLSFNKQPWALIIEILLFILLGFLLYFSIYKILKRKLSKTTYKGPVQDLLMGQKQELLEDSPEPGAQIPVYGKIILQGKEFRTFSIEGQGLIKKGEMVIVKKIEGNVLYIKRA